jgi:DNA-binding CsgD family transcriptional regulator/tetratricopeptide (TPR) repeat protein
MRLRRHQGNTPVFGVAFNSDASPFYGAKRMSAPLVGRKAELAVLAGLLERLDAGRGGAVALVGEPGIGKTRLLGELIGSADTRGHLALTGTASELDRDVPFWVVADALEEYVRGLAPTVLEPLGIDVVADLSQVLPLINSPSAPLAHERYRSHRAVRLLLERLAANRPLVLVLDDMHWADSGSFELLLALLRRPPAAPVLIAAAFRPYLLPDRVERALERAQRAETLTVIQLDALPFEEARGLLGQRDDQDASLIYAESGGNPFFLEHLARSGPSAGGAERTHLAGIEVPPAVAAALEEELAELSDEIRLLLQAAAVVGDPFEPELAAAAAAIDEEVALDALDLLLARDLIRETDVPRRFRFRHPLIRRAVHEAAPAGWRLMAHQRCAETMARRGAPAAARARHVELSARQGDASAVAVLREAGESAAGSAPATAARWFEGALRLVSDDAPAEERVALLLAQARSLAATGQYTESHAALLESIRLVPDEAIAMRMRVIAQCAVVEHQLGRYEEARVRLESALAASDDEDSREAVELMLEVAINRLFQADFDGMHAWAARALAAVGPLGDRVLTATALTIQAAGAALSGESLLGQEKHDEAAALIDGLSDAELGGDLNAMTHLALAEMYLDHFEAARRHADRAMSIYRATGQSAYLTLITAMLGTSLWIRGRPLEAVGVLDGAVEAARLVDDAHNLSWALFNLADAASAAGDLELALSAAEESWELAKPFEPGPIRAHAGSAFAMALLHEGHAAQAADIFMKAAGGPELRTFGGAVRNRYLEALTRCFIAAERHEEAERTVAAAVACAQDVGLASARGMAQLARAALELVRGKAEDASDAAGYAVGAFESVGHADGAAHARVVAGRARALAGDSAGAAEMLEQAALDFESFGASRYRAEVDRELRKLGRTVYRRSAVGTADAGIAALTARELQLARLVVDRQTNAQIAAELFLSKKTVETHLRNIFRKVDVSSRVELARAVERADGGGP